MKRTCLNWGIVCVVLLGISGVFASWSEPILLTELNNSETGQVADFPHISRDGSTLYFGRNDGGRRLYTATQDPETGVFTNLTELSELYDGRNLYSPWVSSDGLRLYYGRYFRGDAINLYQAQRSSISEPWEHTMRFSGIHDYGHVDAFPTLSDDELTMYYASSRGNSNPEDTRIWAATRSSINDPFSSPVEITELDRGYHLTSPCILSNGLEIYYAEKKDNQFDLFYASRESLLDPFSNIEAVSLNTAFGNEQNPTLTADGMEMYFVTDEGIMYSYQIPEPATLALLALGGFMLRKKVSNLQTEELER